jgi:hypothetical protein
MFMPKEDGTTGRRDVLKQLGATTATAGLGLSGASATAVAERASVTGVPNPGNLISEAVKTEAFKKVKQAVQKMGLRVRMNEASAKETSTPEVVNFTKGVVFPLDPTGQVDIWDSEAVDNGSLNVTGHLLWSKNQDESVTARALILGHSEVPESKLSLKNVVRSKEDGSTVALSIVSPSGVTTDVRENSPSVGTQSVSTTKNESVLQCQLDNAGLIGSSDDVITCGACLVPGNGLGVLDVLECFYCASQLYVQNCLVGYCWQQNGGSVGDNYCGVVTTVAETPLSLLPPAYTNAILIAAKAQANGCRYDEGTDCTSPLIP